MTQEEKQLLLTDLCARARYKVKICVTKGVRININGKIKEKNLVDTVYGVIFYNDEPKIVTPQNFSYLDRYGIYNFGGWSVERVKPYLRPMSNMTKKEKCEYRNIDSRSYSCPIDYAHIPASDRINWLNAHHFDYRGLIEKGLALESPKGMYE